MYQPGKMTIQDAIRLLDPKTTVEAIAEVEYYHGFNGRAAAIDAINDACIIACDVMRNTLPEGGKLEPYNFCAGCVNEYDLSCCCHGGRGYEPKFKNTNDNSHGGNTDA